MHRAALVVGACVLTAVWGASEWLHRQASHRRLGDPERSGREAILVLGFRNRGRRANYVNRYRVRVALRSVDVRSTETVLIFSGGAVGSDVAEADLLLQYAHRLGYRGPSVMDRWSESTWENIRNTVDVLDGFDTVKVASNSLHAEKARAYLWAQRPEVARRLVRGQDYRFGEVALLKPVAAFVGVRKLRRLAGGRGGSRWGMEPIRGR